MNKIWLSLWLGVFMFSCATEIDHLEGPAFTSNSLEKGTQFHSNGKPKQVEVFSFEGDTLLGLKEYYESGSLKIQGKVDDKGQRTGVWEAFFENGNYWSQGSYSNGVENGMKIVWYDNGNKRYQGEQVQGKPIGTWSFWNEEGEKTIKKY